MKFGLLNNLFGHSDFVLFVFIACSFLFSLEKIISVKYYALIQTIKFAFETIYIVDKSQIRLIFIFKFALMELRNSAICCAHYKPYFKCLTHWVPTHYAISNSFSLSIFCPFFPFLFGFVSLHAFSCEMLEKIWQHDIHIR